MKLSKVISVIAVFLSVYQIAIGYFGVLPSLQNRPLSVAVLLVILFLTIDGKGKKTEKPGFISWVLAFGAVASSLFVIYNYEWFLTRFAFVTDVTTLERLGGLILILLVLECGRRTIGLILPMIALLTMIYGFFGHLLSGPLHHTNFTFDNIVEQLYMTTEGIWGIPTHAAVTYVFMFVIFGTILSATGMGKFFMDFSIALTGRFAGGPAKTAVFSSALMGMIQGSSISNVVTTGSFTIPTMKKHGFPAHYAAGVEAVASCGGQITPPIMGAAAFIMADLAGIPYIQITKHALIPAILYYVCVFGQIHIRSKKLGMEGMPPDMLPNVWAVLRRQGMYLVPIILVIYFMVKGYTPMRAGFMAIMTGIAIALVFSSDRKQVVKNIVGALASAPMQMVSVIAAVLNAGIVIGMLFMTGLGLRLSSLIVEAAHGYLLLGLMLSMVLAVILGMGMPTSGAYIIMGTLVAPGLEKLGISTIQAHFFVLYFAAMSMITPPVAIASYAAAGIAGADANKVGFTAWKLGLAAFIVPFMFAYGPKLLLVGVWWHSLFPVVSASIGCISLALAIEQHFLVKTKIWERIGLFLVALLLINTSISTDVLGFLIGGAVLVSQYKTKRASVKKAQAVREHDLV